jgi:hypothetical protein
MDINQIKQSITNNYRNLHTLNQSRSYLHEGLQTYISNLAHDYGCDAIREFRLPRICHKNHKNGRLDVCWLKDAVPVLGFEIDSGLRAKSINKMGAMICPSIWIIYPSKPREFIEAKLAELDLPFEVLILEGRLIYS